MSDFPHTFHIPVMGLGYTIDTPLKVARFGISSVVSIIEDHLLEKMRKFHANKAGLQFVPIPVTQADSRAKRITAYLDLLNTLVMKQVEQIKSESLTAGNEIVKYFQLSAPFSKWKEKYDAFLHMNSGNAREELEKQLRDSILPGALDVNIMTKCDRTNYDENGEALSAEYSDAMAALRGFALSTCNSSVVFSAGMNPRLYAYCEQFNDFFPDSKGQLKKKIILKVSDFRSASIQGKFLAKKGLWISEFRIESGLNCGGHAFATDGLLMGPILQEFKEKKTALTEELWSMCSTAWTTKEKPIPQSIFPIRVTVQGGIGTAAEDRFLIEQFGVDGTGWGSPFLLVPEATSVDDTTLRQLSDAQEEDYYLSEASPLGVPIHNFRPSSSQLQRMDRIAKNRSGSPCYKKFLAFNTEFTAEPICTASRQYQHLKIEDLKKQQLSEEKFKKAEARILEKECLCEGLTASALIMNHVDPGHDLNAVAICPGPNLKFFHGVFSLQEMVDHIYGRNDILKNQNRPHMFINELRLYQDHLKKEVVKLSENPDIKQSARLNQFRSNLLEGIAFYRTLSISKNETESLHYRQSLQDVETDILNLEIQMTQLNDGVQFVKH